MSTSECSEGERERESLYLCESLLRGESEWIIFAAAEMPSSEKAHGSAATPAYAPN